MIVCRYSSNDRRPVGAGNMWAYLKIKAAAAWSHTEINVYCREYQMRCWWINLDLDIDVPQSQLAESTVRIGRRDWSARAKKQNKNAHSRCIAALYLKNVSFNVFFLGFDFPSIRFQPWVLLAEVLGWTSAAGTLPVMVWGNGAFNILNCDPRKGQIG